MGRGIIKLNDGQRDWYMIWSTVVDAPITYGDSVDGLRAFIKDESGDDGLRDLPARLARVEAKGTSFHDDATVYDTINFNRAGKGETCLTPEQLIAMYCHRSGDIVGHKHDVDDSLAFCDGKGNYR